jgi:hypothetical protein
MRSRKVRSPTADEAARRASGFSAGRPRDHEFIALKPKPQSEFSSPSGFAEADDGCRRGGRRSARCARELPKEL